MGLKLLLEKDGKILLEVPLSPDDWHKKELKREVAHFQREVEDCMKFYEAFTNENRVRMLQRLLEDEDYSLKFNEFKEDLGLNPKIIREHAIKLRDIGFLESPRRGEYRLSKKGLICFMMNGLAMRRMLRMVTEEY